MRLKASGVGQPDGAILNHNNSGNGGLVRRRRLYHWPDIYRPRRMARPRAALHFY